MKEFIIKRVQSWKFKTLSWIPNQNLISRTLNNTNFYLSTFTAKIKSKCFQINKKPWFVVIFAQKEFFLKTLAKYNCNGPLAFRCQRYRVEYYSITISMKNHSINLLNWSNRLWDTPGLRAPWSIRPHPFWTCPFNIHLTFGFPFKATFDYPEFLQKHQKSVYSINSLRYSQF